MFDELTEVKHFKERFEGSPFKSVLRNQASINNGAFFS